MGLDIEWVKKKEEYIEGSYFRKVNFLVAYIENNTRYDRESPWVEWNLDMAKDLLDRCNRVLKYSNLVGEELDNCEKCLDEIKELLPNTEGFFFGSQDYDKYYFQDVLKVKNFLEETLIPMLENLGEGESIGMEMSW